MEAFQYEPLDLGLRSFRLLMLYPGGGDIRCDIFQASLEPDEIIPYEALSYAWGCTDLVETISASGKRLFVTRNLFSALNHLRTEEARILRVDAICIDQSNLAERGHQVGHMAGIYRQVEKVLVWLGHSTPDTKFLMDALNKTRRESKSSRGNISCPASLLDPVLISGDSNGLRKGSEHLLEQLWFTRVWVLQEVSYARVALICCGHHSIPAHIFVEATRLAGIKLDDRQQALLDLMPRPSNKRSARKKTLYTLLVQFRKMEATDPRDMVYALLGIASDIQQDATAQLLSADYQQSEEQLILDLKTYLFLGGTQDRLGYCPDMLLFLDSLPTLANDTLVDLVFADRMEDAKLLCDGHVSLEHDFNIKLPGNDFKITQNFITAIRQRKAVKPQGFTSTVMTSRSRSHARRLEYALQQSQAAGLQEKLLERLERLLKEMVYWGIPITQEAFIAMLRWMGPTRSTEIIEGQCEVFEVDQKLVEEIRKSFLHEPMRRWIEAMIDSDNIEFGFDVVGYCRQFEDKSDKSWSHSASVAYYYGTQPGVGSSLHSPH